MYVNNWFSNYRLCLYYKVRDKNCSELYFFNTICYAVSNLLLGAEFFPFISVNASFIFSYVLLVFKCFFFKTPSRLVPFFNISFVCKTN